MRLFRFRYTTQDQGQAVEATGMIGLPQPVEDELVLPSVQRPDWEALCADGWPLEHLLCAGADHPETTPFSIPEQLAWLRARIDGEQLDAACVWTEPVCCEGSNDEAWGD